MRSALKVGLAIVAIAVLVFLFLQPRDEPPKQKTSAPPAKEAAPATQQHRQPRHDLPKLSVAPASSAASAEGEPTFSGRVLSRDSGGGVPEAELTFSRAEASHSIITAADGSFVFTPPAAGTYQLAAVTAKDHLPFAPAWGESPLVFTARPGRKITDLIVYLEREKIITGRVIDPQHKAVAGAKITLLIPAEENMALISLPAEHQSDAAGAFQFRAPIGTLVEAQHPSFALAQQRLTTAAHQKGELTITLSPKTTEQDRLTITGKVIDDRDTPVPNALVTASRGGAGRGHGDGRDWWTTRSDEGGNFELTDLEPGPHELAASSPSFVPARKDGVEAGARDVVLRLHQNGGFIAGRVTGDGASDGVASFMIVISKPVGRIEERAVATRSFLDAEGRYSLGPFEEGSYRVRAVAHGYSAPEPLHVEVRIGATSSGDFRLSRGATVFGTVLHGQTPGPVAGARVELEGRSLGEALPIEIETAVLSDRDGSFRLAGIGAGLRSINVEAKGYDSRIVSGLQFVEGATLGPIEVRLTPLASPDAEPKRELTGIGAALSAEGDVLLIGQVIEGGGAFEAGLQAGDYILEIDGRSVGELDLNGAVQLIRGPEGSAVLLTIRRAQGREEEITVYRRKIRA